MLASVYTSAPVGGETVERPGVLMGEPRSVLVGVLSPSRQYKQRCRLSFGEGGNQETADEGW